MPKVRTPMSRSPQMTKTMLTLVALLGTAACSHSPGDETLYVLRDSAGSAVALAGGSQLGGAAPGTMMRATIGGAERNVMVGERVGRGSVLAPAPAAPVPTMEASPPASEITSAPLAAPVAAAPAGGESLARTSTTSVQPRRAAPASRSNANPPPRRREPPPRSISRSVM
jgi:hypothetical protein